MIEEFYNIRERSERAKFLCLGYKANNWSIEKYCGPKKATWQIIGAASAAPAAPLPTPMLTNNKYSLISLAESTWPCYITVCVFMYMYSIQATHWLPVSGVIWNWSSSISAHTPPMEPLHMRKPRSRVDWKTPPPSVVFATRGKRLHSHWP